MQKRFLDRFVKEVDNGWDEEARVQLAIRRPAGASRRWENEFPLARTVPTRFYLDASDRSLSRENPSSASEIVYEATGDGLTFTTAPFDEDVEVTGFVTLRLWPRHRRRTWTSSRRCALTHPMVPK